MDMLILALIAAAAAAPGEGKTMAHDSWHAMTIVKEWGAATPQLMAIKPTYDVKKVEGSGARSATDEWSPMTLANAGGLCPAAEAAAKRATKTRSNIQNN
jgi:hypothetical protein